MRSWTIAAGVGVIVGALGLTGAATGQCQVLKRTNPGSASYDDFGTLVAGGGSRYVVTTDLTNTQPGSQAFVLRRDGTTLVNEGQLVVRQTLPGGGLSNFYTQSVATDGETVALGDRFFNDFTGGVLVFTRSGTTWSQTQTLLAPPYPGEPNMEFGTAVAVRGDLMAVTAASAGIGDDNIPIRGAVFIYKRQGGVWALDQTIANPFDADVFTTSRFGASVQFKGNALVFSAEGEGNDPFDPGSVYIYRESPTGYVYEAALRTTLADDFVAGFGYAVGFDGDLCVVGAPTEAAIYVWRKVGGTWTRTARVGYPWRPWPGPSRFGCTLFVRDGGATGQDLIVVGDSEAGKFGTNSGLVTVFRGTPTSAGAQVFSSDDADVAHRFGISMAVDSTGALLVGAKGANAAYLIGGFDADCDNNGLTNLCEIHAGVADANADGVPDACQSAPACPADFNGQNGVDLLDIFAFLNHWFGGCTGPGTPSPSCVKSADFNNQNGVDLLDIFAFLNAWFAGPCT